VQPLLVKNPEVSAPTIFIAFHTHTQTHTFWSPLFDTVPRPFAFKCVRWIPTLPPIDTRSCPSKVILVFAAERTYKGDIPACFHAVEGQRGGETLVPCDSRAETTPSSLLRYSSLSVITFVWLIFTAEAMKKIVMKEDTKLLAKFSKSATKKAFQSIFKKKSTFDTLQYIIIMVTNRSFLWIPR
jgi:hypothetical protein